MQGRSLRAARKMEDALKAARAGPLILRRRDGLRRRGAFLLRWRGRNKNRRRGNVNAEQLTMSEESKEYRAFVDKFKPKLTTDDCYTPEKVYDVVRGWVFEHYGLDPSTQVIRPFWPGGDYQHAEYPAGCVVIDNPPFSKMAEIESFYLARGIQFFLFAPALCMFKPLRGLHYVCCGAEVVYHNGAKVSTSFVTNLGPYLVDTAPELHERIEAASRENEKKGKKQVAKLEYPMELATAARLQWLSAHGVHYYIREGEGTFVRKLDGMAKGKSIYGNGFLLSERAAAERAAAERAVAKRAAAERAVAKRAAAQRFALSPREWAIVRSMSGFPERVSE